MAFTVAAVPTGMKAGVRITPRGIEIAPVRAAPSRAWTENVKAAVSVNVVSSVMRNRQRRPARARLIAQLELACPVCGRKQQALEAAPTGGLATPAEAGGRSRKRGGCYGFSHQRRSYDKENPEGPQNPPPGHVPYLRTGGRAQTRSPLLKHSA